MKFNVNLLSQTFNAYTQCFLVGIDAACTVFKSLLPYHEIIHLYIPVSIVQLYIRAIYVHTNIQSCARVHNWRCNVRYNSYAS